MLNLGIVRPGSTIRIPFSTFDKDDGSSITMTNFAVGDILVYKDGSTTERASTSGYTATTDFDSKTGKQLIVIDLSDNTTAGFWAAGSEYLVAIDAVTVDSVTTGGWTARFTIGHVGAWFDTTIATLSSQTSFTLTTGPAEDSALVGRQVLIHDVASAVQCAFGIVSAYTGSTKTVTLAAAPTFNIAATDNISIMSAMPLQPATAGRSVVVDSAGLADANMVKHGPTGSGSAVTAGAIPAAVAGAASGLLIAGTNAPTIFSGTGPALKIESTSFSSQPALSIVGGTSTGAGVKVTGGTTGDAISLVGGATSGRALIATTTSGNALEITGGGSGHGAILTGGSTGDGVRLTRGGSSNDDLYLTNSDAPTLGVDALSTQVQLRAPRKTWFVETTGNDSNAGTAAAPLLTIAAANTAASNGDTIQVGAGTWTETVVLTKKNLTLRGVGDTTIITQTHSNNTDITVTMADGGRVANMKIVAVTKGCPLNCTSKSDCSADSCWLVGVFDGLQITTSNNFVGTNLRITGTYDAINAYEAQNFYFDRITASTDGSHTGTADYRALFCGNNSTGVVRNSKLTSTSARTSFTRQISAVESSGASSFIGLYGCTLSASATDASISGTVSGINIPGSPIASAVMIAHIEGGSVTTSNSGSGSTYDFAASPTGSKMRVIGTKWSEDPTKLSGPNNIDFGRVPSHLLSTTISSVTSQTVLVLTAGSADNDAYNDGIAVISDATTGVQKAFVPVDDYTGSTKTLTLAATPGFTVAATDRIDIISASGLTTTTVSDIASSAGGSVSAFLVDEDHTWGFQSRSQVTSPNFINEFIGFNGLLSMDFTNPIPGSGSISSIGTVAFADESGKTEPTLSSASLSPDKKKVHIPVNATAATAGTYTLSVTITTTDSQTFLRKGRLVIQ